MKCLIFLLLILFTISCLFSQSITFEKNYGGSGWDEGRSVKQTKDGGYIIVGVTNFFDLVDSDILIIKTDKFGDTLWTKTFGGNNEEDAFDIELTNDGGFVICGRTSSYGNGNFDFYIIRTDENGSILWTRTFGTSNVENGYSICSTADGCYVVTGNSRIISSNESKILILKIDDNGNFLWNKYYKFKHDNVASSINNTTDNGFIITGYAGDDFYKTKILLFKINSEGDSLWSELYGPNLILNKGYKSRQTADGGYIVIGESEIIQGGGLSIICIKTDSLGVDEWSEYYGDYTSLSAGRDIIELYDGSFIALGQTIENTAGFSDLMLFGIDNQGNMLWSKLYGDSTTDAGMAMDLTDNLEYIITGVYNFRDINNLLFTANVYLIKTDANGNVTSLNDIRKLPVDHNILQNYPNPFNPKTTIKFSVKQSSVISLFVYDNLGREIRRLINNERKNTGDHSIIFNANGLPSGIFYLVLKTDSYQEAKKIILLQ